MSAVDRLEDGYPHGTVEGFDNGCRGGYCPGEEEHGISCRRAKHLAAGDWRYSRLVAQGLTPAQIAAELGETPHEHPAPEPRRTVVPDDDDEGVQVDDLDEEPIEGEDPIMNTTTAPSPATIIKSRKPEPQDVPEWPDEASDSDESPVGHAETGDPTSPEGFEVFAKPGQRQSEIRAWARENGIPVNTRGSVRASVVEAYDLAHGHITVEVPAEPATASPRKHRANPDAEAARKWARDHGIEIAETGRVAKRIVAAFRADDVSLAQPKRKPKAEKPMPEHGTDARYQRGCKDENECLGDPDTGETCSSAHRTKIREAARRRRAAAKQAEAETVDPKVAADLNAEADGEPDLIPTVEEYGARLRAIQQRQVEKGYTPEHDDAHGVRHLLNWAIDYARRGRTDDAAGLVLSALGSLDRTEQSVVVHGPVADMETRAQLFNEGWDEARRQSVEVTIEALAESLDFALMQWAAAMDRAQDAEARADAAERELAARRPWWKRLSA